MNVTGILETVLYATDLDAVEQFYEEILGLEKLYRDPKRQVFFRCGNAMLLIFNPEETVKKSENAPLPVPAHGALGNGHVCFRASAVEIEQWYNRLSAHGIEIESDFEWPNGGRSIYFRDPAGNSLEFAEPRIWGLE
ncbi:MAG: VOC family protein [Pseudomonadota bacterium]